MTHPIQILRKPPEPGTAGDARPLSPVDWPEVAARLRDYAAARGVQARPDERCDLCGAAIEAEHGHLVNLAERSLLCACRPCYLLFMHDGAGGSRFRAVPQRFAPVPELTAIRENWDLLDVPIGLAFLFRNSATGRTTAFYPSPAGATESELPLDRWSALVDVAPVLTTMADDVEALLVRRTESAMVALIVPIDACYELVGRIRRSWSGFQGGDQTWREIDAFFARAVARAQSASGTIAAEPSGDDPHRMAEASS